MQNNTIAFILERRSDAGTSGGARWMCLVAGQTNKFLQKVTFVKSSKLLFQLLWVIGCHKYSIWNWISLLRGAMKGKWCVV